LPKLRVLIVCIVKIKNYYSGSFMKYYGKRQYGLYYENINRSSGKMGVFEETSLSNNNKTARKFAPIIQNNIEYRNSIKSLIEAFQGKIILSNSDDFQMIMNLPVVYPLRIE
jgi:hypothetical protein